MSEKSQLTVEEIYKVAYLHHVMKVEQHALSIAFSVNPGRIAEACMAMKYAASNVKLLYNAARGQNGSETLQLQFQQTEELRHMPKETLRD